MDLQKKESRHSHRGVIGVESAIVMIAFVIVAAALAFVVLNMGFATTQKTKNAIVSSAEESSSAIEIAGKIIGSGDVAAGKLNATAIPIKVVAGGSSVNLNPSNAAVRYLSNNIEHGNIYEGAIPAGVYDTMDSAMSQAVTLGYLTGNPISGGGPNATAAIVYFNVNRNDNFILDQGEHAILAIAFKTSERPQSLDTLRAELILPTGAPLTIERVVPNISHAVVDLG